MGSCFSNRDAILNLKFSIDDLDVPEVQHEGARYFNWPNCFCCDIGDCGYTVNYTIFCRARLDKKTKTCTVVDKKPKTIIARVVGDGTYRTEAEAEKGMKIIKVCIK